jgi:hypothetical protein
MTVSVQVFSDEDAAAIARALRQIQAERMYGAASPAAGSRAADDVDSAHSVRPRDTRCAV